jgi:hypothetical protein
MSDEISHAEAAAYVPSSEPSSEPAKDYSADVVKDIAEKAWDVIQRSADIDVDDYVEEQKDRAADEKGEELPQNRKRERRERFEQLGIADVASGGNFRGQGQPNDERLPKPAGWLRRLVGP